MSYVAICEEVAVTELVKTMSIGEDPFTWARQIRNSQKYERRGYVQEMRRSGFDVTKQVSILTKFYETGKWDG